MSACALFKRGARRRAARQPSNSLPRACWAHTVVPWHSRSARALRFSNARHSNSLGVVAFLMQATITSRSLCSARRKRPRLLAWPAGAGMLPQPPGGAPNTAGGPLMCRQGVRRWLVFASRALRARRALRPLLRERGPSRPVRCVHPARHNDKGVSSPDCRRRPDDGAILGPLLVGGLCSALGSPARGRIHTPRAPRHGVSRTWHPRARLLGFRRLPVRGHAPVRRRYARHLSHFATSRFPVLSAPPTRRGR